MDTQRLILFVALSFISLMLWDAWQLDHGAGQPSQQTQQQEGAAIFAPASPETRNVEAGSGGVPRVAAPETEQSGGQPRVAVEREMRASGTPITVQTDLLEVIINTEGGDLRQVDLLKHGQDSDHKNE